MFNINKKHLILNKMRFANYDLTSIKSIFLVYNFLFISTLFLGE